MRIIASIGLHPDGGLSFDFIDTATDMRTGGMGRQQALHVSPEALSSRTPALAELRDLATQALGEALREFYDRPALEPDEVAQMLGIEPEAVPDEVGYENPDERPISR